MKLLKLYHLIMELSEVNQTLKDLMLDGLFFTSLHWSTLSSEEQIFYFRGRKAGLIFLKNELESMDVK